jgi:branched-chain amino acid transport system substrate-binding protein
MVLVVATAAPACADETLLIGGIGDMSGQGAIWGQALEGALQTIAHDVNAGGGLKVGGVTYKIDIRMYDDQYQSAKSVAAAHRLVDEDGAKFVFGPFSASGAIATRPIFEQAKVIDFVVGAYSRKVLEGQPKYLFRISDTPAEFTQPMVAWLKKDGPKDIKRVAVVNPNDEAGWDMQQLEDEAYPAAGYAVVGKELYERSVKDFQPILTRIFADQPDLIDLGGSAPASAGLIVRQAREMGYKGAFIKIGGPGPQQIMTAAGPAAEGVMQYLSADPAYAGYQRVNAEFKQLFGHDMDSSLPATYDGFKVLLAAIQKAGSIDTDEVVAAIPKVMPFPSMLGGEIRLSGKKAYGEDHQFLTPVYVGVIHDGGIKTTTLED